MHSDSMTCREFVDLLDAFLERELSSTELRRMEAHASNCVRCSAYRDAYADTIKLAKDSATDDDSKAAAKVPEALVRSILKSRKR